MTEPVRIHTPKGNEVELLPWSDQDLDEMSQITETDIERAKRYWRRCMSHNCANCSTRFGWNEVA